MTRMNRTNRRGRIRSDANAADLLRILYALSLPLLCLALALAGCSGSSTTPTSAETHAVDVTEIELGAELEILAFQAGKADAFLLTTPDSTILIDCGVKGFGKTILAELESRGIDAVDYLIITHFDQDHVGGAARVINNIKVMNVLQSNSPKDSEEYEKYVKALGNASLEAETVRETSTYQLDGLQFTVDPPHSSRYSSDSSNNSSLIVSVSNGYHTFLFPGDAETERLEEFLNWNRDHYDVLKVPHHGKEEPLLAELIQNVTPEYAVITSSDDEPESEDTLALLEAAGVETYLTRTAPVIIKSGADGLSVGYAE